ncbi:MAG: hypothetical protein LIV26_07920 [Atopobium sp.]|jgi:LuxR family transcriptional regulator, maltose regulon positive regulatory protein|nr:hypothetical protein [Atopobium sp.]
MLGITSKIQDIYLHGSPDIEFAATGLLARTQVTYGSAEDARQTILKIRESFLARSEDFFIPNIDAMLARLALRTGASSAWERWYRNKAPKELLRPCAMDRYVYVTPAEAEVARDCPGQALAVLARGDVSSSAASMQSTSSCSTRSKPLPFPRIEEESGTYESPEGEGGSWRVPLARALASASRFSSVQPIATFGIAVLPLLQESDWNEDPKFLARTIAFSRQQATFYPKFTQPPVKLERPLTPTEEKVPRLIPQTSRMPLSARSWTSSFRL